jgi:hypothetical protein
VLLLLFPVCYSDSLIAPLVLFLYLYSSHYYLCSVLVFLLVYPISFCNSLIAVPIKLFLYVYILTKEMDAGALVDEIEDIIGVKVGLRWKIIDVGSKGKLPESQRVRALNVEVNSKERWDAQRRLIHHFGRNMQPKDTPTVSDYDL